MGKAPITTDDDRRHEQGEEVPGRGHQALGHRGEPEAEGEGEDGDPGEQRLPLGRERGHGVASFRRTRPSRRTARPWIAPSSAETTYCQVKEYSPSRPA